jgi:AcrR family transcriptional regulator
MPRSGRESRARLQQAAIELVLERGFDAVTTAEIAERAGVSERTYFRHFPDKREVLFEGENQLADQITDALAQIPLTVAPLTALHRAFLAVVPMLEKNRHAQQRLARVIATTPAVRERAAAKEGRLVETSARLLRERGVPADDADLAARAASALSAHAMYAWQMDPAVGLREHVERSFRRLGTLAEPGDLDGSVQ